MNPFLPCNLSDHTLRVIKAALLADRSQQQLLSAGSHFPTNAKAWARNIKRIDALVAHIDKILSP